MKNTHLIPIALCGLIFTFASSTAAQTAQSPTPARAQPRAETAEVKTYAAPNIVSSDSNGDVEALRHRLEEVESQNRALTQTVLELKARMDALTPAAAASTSSAPSTSQASVATAQTSVASSQTSSPSSQVDKNQPVRWSELLGEGNKIRLYGFLRLDLDFDSQHPNNTQNPLFITSPDARAGGTTNGDYSMHPRLTRFGIDYAGPHIAKLGNAKLSGKVETDFANGGSESRQIIRIRHAYLRLDWKEAALLAGQTWDIVSPLFPTVNNDSLMWNAGNVGDRRPQLRAAYEPKAGRGKLSFIGGIGLTGAIDAQDLDNNGFRDGEESGRPDMQGRIGYSYPLGKDRTASIGLSGFYGFERTARPVAGRTVFHPQLFNVDFTIPLATRLSWRGEGWWGRNMSDIRGGAGQAINLSNGREIRGRGGWSEANIRLSRYFSVNPGFTIDDPVNADLPNGGRTRNHAYYFANRITPGGNFLIGADYLRWLTDYKGLQRGVANRVNIFLQYNF
jgi:hypothetical protein